MRRTKVKKHLRRVGKRNVRVRSHKRRVKKKSRSRAFFKGDELIIQEGLPDINRVLNHVPGPSPNELIRQEQKRGARDLARQAQREQSAAYFKRKEELALERLKPVPIVRTSDTVLKEAGVSPTTVYRAEAAQLKARQDLFSKDINKIIGMRKDNKSIPDIMRIAYNKDPKTDPRFYATLKRTTDRWGVNRYTGKGRFTDQEKNLLTSRGHRAYPRDRFTSTSTSSSTEWDKTDKAFRGLGF